MRPRAPEPALFGVAQDQSATRLGRSAHRWGGDLAQGEDLDGSGCQPLNLPVDPLAVGEVGL